MRFFKYFLSGITSECPIKKELSLWYTIDAMLLLINTADDLPSKIEFTIVWRFFYFFFMFRIYLSTLFTVPTYFFLRGASPVESLGFVLFLVLGPTR